MVGKARTYSRHFGLVTAIACLALAAEGCGRHKSELRPAPPRTAIYANAATESDLHPGGAQPLVQVNNPYEGNASAIAEGQRLFSWYNCSGCHANGGGGMGPPLMDDEWIYGSSPENIYNTIVQGRPNGMPSFAGKIPSPQIWQLVTYVRSLSGLTPMSGRSA